MQKKNLSQVFADYQHHGFVSVLVGDCKNSAQSTIRDEYDAILEYIDLSGQISFRDSLDLKPTPIFIPNTLIQEFIAFCEGQPTDRRIDHSFGNLAPWDNS